MPLLVCQALSRPDRYLTVRIGPKGRMMANTWQGEFPWQNLALDRYEGTSPVGAFPCNGYGLYDLAGNVWEWAADPYTDNQAADPGPACCAPQSPQMEDPASTEPIHRRVIKGGSHLCAPNYCLRYRRPRAKARR
jgi:sulfatase modifying factor 1